MCIGGLHGEMRRSEATVRRAMWGMNVDIARAPSSAQRRGMLMGMVIILSAIAAVSFGGRLTRRRGVVGLIVEAA